MIKDASRIDLPAKIFIVYVLLVFSGLPDYFPIVSSLKLGSLCALSLFLFWLCYGDCKREVYFKEVGFFIAIIFLSVLSLFYAENSGSIFKLLQTEVTYFFGFILGAIVALRSRKSLDVFLRMWAILLIVVPLQVVASGGQGPGTLGDENDVSVVMATMVPFAYYGMSYFKGGFRLICIVALVTLCSAVIVAGSRGGFLGLAMVFIAIFLYSKRKYCFILIGGSVMLVAVNILVPDEYIGEVKSIQNASEGTADERLYSWGIGMDIFLDNPILGVGTGQYAWNAWKYQEQRGDLIEGWNKRRHLGGRSSHSTYIDYLSERGLVGVFLFFIAASSLRLRSISLKKHLNASVELDAIAYSYSAIRCGFLGFAVCSAFVSSFYFPMMWLLFGLVLGTHGVLVHEGSHSEICDEGALK
ncbi:O-antigen ligase family protein [Porticoccus sp. GXU_MW_L64]